MFTQNYEETVRNKTIFWNLFLYGKPGLGIFEETGAGSSDGRNLVKEVIFKNHGLLGRCVAEEGWLA